MPTPKLLFPTVDGPVTRERLHDGSLLAALRASAPPGMVLRSDEELAASLDETLATHPDDEPLWLFGYGSLMWNPAFHYLDALPATVRGWSRRFCLWLYTARGTPEVPGLMLALDRGGGCRGIGFRIAPEQVRTELTLLWRREMLGGTYDARWVQADIGGQRSRALTFVANRRHPRYAGALQPDEAVRHIATAAGSLGSCRAYFEQTVETLARLGIRDAAIERLRAALAQLPPAPPAASAARDGVQAMPGAAAVTPSSLSNP